MSKQKVLFFTTCHGAPIAFLLRQSSCFNEKYEEMIISNWTDNPEENLLNNLKDTNVLIYQNFHHLDKDHLLSLMQPDGLVIKIPYITTKIYWPSHNLHPLFIPS